LLGGSRAFRDEPVVVVCRRGIEVEREGVRDGSKFGE
jgi:hypothetical protein